MNIDMEKLKEFIEQQNDKKAPLTKSRKKKVVIEEKKEDVVEEAPEVKSEVIEKVKKQRKPKTEKQIESFKKVCAAARAKNLNKKRMIQLRRLN